MTSSLTPVYTLDVAENTPAGALRLRRQRRGSDRPWTGECRSPPTWGVNPCSRPSPSLPGRRVRLRPTTPCLRRRPAESSEWWDNDIHTLTNVVGSGNRKWRRFKSGANHSNVAQTFCCSKGAYFFRKGKSCLDLLINQNLDRQRSVLRHFNMRHFLLKNPLCMACHITGVLHLRGVLGALLHPQPGGRPLLRRLHTRPHVWDGALAGSVVSAGFMADNYYNFVPLRLSV